MAIISRKYSLYLLLIFTLSCQVAEALNEPVMGGTFVKEWLERQREAFYFSGINSLPFNVANALNPAGIILKNKV